jgi:glycosyltransferase involved in cell wall biosynthesis
MKISACWIVKNEAENIAASIMSVGECARELVVVDTGSGDDTPRIAAECGARVEQFPWTGDFSAARNYALSLVTGEYVIFPDGDEFFTPALNKADRSVISDFFEETDADVLQIPRAEMDAGTGQVLDTAPYGRILRRGTIRYAGMIHEMPRLENGGVPRVALLDKYLITHTGYSSGRVTQKLLRNIELLEREQVELGDEFRLFTNKAYLMREYMALGSYEKAFENCRYLLDHYEQWGVACKTYSFNFIQRFYAAIGLAAVLRFRFSRKEVWEKLFMGIIKNYPGSREAALADLYYRLVFNYREDVFLKELEEAEKLTVKMPPSSIPESKNAEAAIYGRGALAAHFRGDVERASRWAGTALRIAPTSNRTLLRAILEE